MRLPVIKSVIQFIEQNDEDFILEAIEVLEHISQARGIKDEEMMVIGELISNLFGALEVAKAVREGQAPKEALNAFMKRVMGSIDPEK